MNTFLVIVTLISFVNSKFLLVKTEGNETAVQKDNKNSTGEDFWGDNNPKFPPYKNVATKLYYSKF